MAGMMPPATDNPAVPGHRCYRSGAPPTGRVPAA